MSKKHGKLERRKAEELTVGKPYAAYGVARRDGNVRLAPGCTRFVYHQLKRKESRDAQ